MSLKVCTIASGSKGNCIYVASRNTELVIDLGISYRKAERLIKAVGGSGIENILLTHTHTDHFASVPTALKKGATLYYNHRCRGEVFGYDGKLVETKGRFEVGDISVLPFEVSHDVPCVGYTLRCGASKLSVVTDLGHLPDTCMDVLSRSQTVIIESNYDDSLLESNPRYPVWLKRRIAGNSGHLSNAAAANAVCELARGGTSQIILAHLSENNNTRQKAIEATEAALDRSRLRGGVQLAVAEQDAVGELYEVF